MCIRDSHEITLVLTQPDRPAGRGMQLQASPVKQCAIKHGTPVAQPVSLRLNGKYPDVAQEAHALLQSTPHDVMVVAAYGLILPRSVLDIPRLGCINIHGSLLPRWRGAAPIHRAIEAGDTETGITIMQMEEGLDTGPMMLIESVPIAEDDTTGSLHDKLAALGGEPRLRLNKNGDGKPLVTDNGCYIIDVLGLAITDPADIEDKINNIVGVVTNGLFARQGANVCLLGTAEGVKKLEF